MKHGSPVAIALGLLAFSGAGTAQDPVPELQDLVGVRGSAGESELQARGYDNVGGSKSGDASWTYWRKGETGRCLAVKTEQGRYRAIVSAPEADCRGGAKAAPSVEEGLQEGEATSGRFDTVCGVIVAGTYYRYRCVAVDFYLDGARTRTVLNYPDQRITLAWKAGNEAELRFEGMAPQTVRISIYEGETSFEFEGKTYFYISNRDAARLEMQHFED